jgi:hypothetical protein
MFLYDMVIERTKKIKKQKTIEERIRDEQKKLSDSRKWAEEQKKKRELSQIKSQRRKIITTEMVRPFKQFGSKLGTIADNITLNTEIQQSGVKVGDRVMITNGNLSGRSIIIESFVLGGIQGGIGLNEVRIRHGSYKRI